jgi:hypothetical protein
MFTKKIFILFLLIFSVQLHSAPLLIEWARPLKKNLIGENRREQGGIASFGENILVVTRNGRMLLVSTKGEIKKSVKFDGEFYFTPETTEKGEIFVPVSNTLFCLDKDFNIKWSISGRAPISSEPFIDGDKVFVQFHDNSIYLVNRSSGEIRTTYTYYTNDEISFIRLAKPFYMEDKIVFSFSNGMVFHFALRKNSAGTEELVPWFRIRTSKQQRSLDKRNFYDLLSIIPINDSTLLYSGGEYGGIISEGRSEELKKMRNVKLVQEKDGSLSGYGEGGIFLYGKDGEFLLDESGEAVVTPFVSENYITNNIMVGNSRVITTVGAGSMISYNEGFIHLLSEDYSKVLYSVMVPNGISAKGLLHKGSVYILSDMGVLYKLNISK